MSITPPHHRSQGNILLVTVVFLGVFVTVGTALLTYLNKYALTERIAIASAQAQTIAEGAIDNAVYQLNQNTSYAGETDTPLGEGTFTVTVTSIDSNTKRIMATASVPNSAAPIAVKIIKANIGLSDASISFHYGIQVGQGGFQLENSSSITGNVFSGGSIIGTSANNITGDVVSSGPSGLVYGIHSTGSVYAHTIGNASAATIVDKDAYYTTKTNTTVTGTSNPGSPDQPSAPLPISDAQIADWETQAAAGGPPATCSGGLYQISSGTATLGPKKIPCNLEISGSSVVTIAGHIWVTGNIKVKNSATVKMAASLGAQNVAIIADNPADQINSSTIEVSNTASFGNSGTPGSYVFLISQNKSAETGGSVPAFTLSNSASAIVAYAAHGLIPLANSVSLKEVTAYKVHLKNSANVIYDTGLPSSVFESGPGGSWGFIPGSYAIIK